MEGDIVQWHWNVLSWGQYGCVTSQWGEWWSDANLYTNTPLSTYSWHCVYSFRDSVVASSSAPAISFVWCSTLCTDDITVNTCKIKGVCRMTTGCSTALSPVIHPICLVQHVLSCWSFRPPLCVFQKRYGNETFCSRNRMEVLTPLFNFILQENELPQWVVFPDLSVYEESPKNTYRLTFLSFVM